MIIVAMGIGVEERNIPRRQSDDYRYMVLHEARLLLKSPLNMQKQKIRLHRISNDQRENNTSSELTINLYMDNHYLIIKKNTVPLSFLKLWHVRKLHPGVVALKNMKNNFTIFLSFQGSAKTIGPFPTS